MKKIFIGHFIFLFSLGVFAQSNKQEKIKWQYGPLKATLGTQATIKLSKKYQFLDARATKKLQTKLGNTNSNKELGSVFPSDKKKSWFLLFEYEDSGYIRDDEKDDLDASKLLEGYKRSTEASNEYRKKKGIAPLTVLGWSEKPHYDAKTNNLVWALLAQSNGRKIVNYNMRLLGRGGYFSVILVTGASTLNQDKKEAIKLISKYFKYNKGKKYTEFKEGDSVAKYGLMALIAGGGGLAAAKLGLFAKLGKFLLKGWKVIAVVIAGLLAGIKKYFSKKP